MKILSIMCDMVRPNILDFENCSSDSYEHELKRLGGTLYRNCFSPGPDTGRSMGCYWSGKIPQDNGCDTRAKYPKFYLKSECFLDILSDKGFEFYFFTNPNEKILGDLPGSYDEKGTHNLDLDLRKFVSGIDLLNDNIYVNIFLTDFHWAIDDYGATGEGVEQGLRILKDSINIVFEMIEPNSFDYIIIFSDHGFKYNVEFESQEKYMFLNRDRSNTLMFIHKKGDNAFFTNDKLCSIIDVYPTIMDIVGEDYNGYAYSLFSDKEHEFIIADDHGDFLPRVNQLIEYWAVIKKDVIYIRSFTDYYRDDGKKFDLDKQKFDDFLCRNSKSFAEVFKQLNILKLYQTMATDKSYYTNGEVRYMVEKKDFVKRLHRKMNRYTTRETYKKKR